MALSSGGCPSAKAASYLVNHIVLPPQLPQEDDFDCGHERFLLRTTIDALHALKIFVTNENAGALAKAIMTIENLQRIQDDSGHISEAELCKLLDELAHGKNKGCIPLEVKAQNAGILISSDGTDATFECFELSPINKSAMLKGRLIRSFPGLAANIPVVQLQEKGLRQMLANTLAKLSTQTAPGFQPVAYKAGQYHDEERDTTHPGMVTDFLLNVVIALGKEATVTRITKNTREEVLWNNCKLPWRRSPMWLLVRVTLQLLFTRQSPNLSATDSLYKVFMVQILSMTLSHAEAYWQMLGSGYMHVTIAKMLQRLRKLETLSQLGCIVPAWIDLIQKCMEDAFAFMKEKWQAETHNTGTNLITADLKSLHPENALNRIGKPPLQCPASAPVILIQALRETMCLEISMQLMINDATVSLQWRVGLNTTFTLGSGCTGTSKRHVGNYMPSSNLITTPPFVFIQEFLGPNEVIASLPDCPPHFSIEEYKAFSALPLGREIFYSNILTQLAIPTLDFSKVETQCLILQTVTQTGLPGGTVERVNHRILTDYTFGSAMIARLEDAAQRVEENWESWRALATFIQLACRTANLAASPEVRERCLQFLCKARCTSVIWLHRLKARAASSTDDEQRTDLLRSATNIALIGVTAFNVETEFLDTIMQQEGAISSLLQCSIAIQENQRLLSDTECLNQHAVQAWRSLMYRICITLRDAILRDCSGLNEAVIMCWTAFRPAANAGWTVLNHTHPHWLHIVSGKLPVHINLLTGELLVNGLPLTRLPPAYLEHHMYSPLFSASALEVAPTDEPGMRFSAKTTYHSHELHFGMDSADMLIVAKIKNKKFDLLPAHLLVGSLPHAFVTSYVHWYDHTSGNVVLRPRENPWQDCNDQWHLHRYGASWRMQKGSQTLLNMKSKDAQRVSTLLKSVEDEAYIHISLDMSSQTLKVEVPRLKLDFHINGGDDKIHSRQYRGMIIDNDQGIGSLIGLTSKLVLRRASNPTDRLVLIPEGTVDYRKTLGHHLSVSISKQNNTVVHAYQLDLTLRRVLDNGALQSKLLLCYLHALTSHWLPDALTCCTGTEAALTILRSSAVRSFSGLSRENVTLLNNIATLSPSRRYYPSHERVMQQIGWDPQLPFASQHLDFQILVKEIFVHEETMSLFHQNNIFEEIDSKGIAWMTSIDFDLHHRAIIRSSTFFIADFGAEHFSTKFDAVYKARDQDQTSARGQRAFSAAAMLLRDQLLFNQKVSRLQIYQRYFKDYTAKGFSNTQELPELSYDSKWMEPPSKFIRDIWCALHHSMAKEKLKTNDSNVMIWLANMAYAPEADMDVVRAFVAFYRVPQFASFQIPARPLYTLSRGRSWPDIMIEFGLAITTLHKAQRLVALLDNPVEFKEEFQHVGHTNWDPYKFPETLLLEAESGILVRKVQADIAAHMIQPPDARNTVMQLNMGEGKSTTIVPMVAVAHSDRRKLARVVVAKPQSSQMLEMLTAKLGGLLDRRIYHMPFSRDLRLGKKDAQVIRELYEDCMARRGILLVQPEHILSFKLMGIECLLADKQEVAQSLLSTQQWFHDVSRDIVDESDENFSVKFELIYTMGTQRSINFAPDRWLLIQEILRLIPRLAQQVRKALPHSIEMHDEHQNKYPRVRILRDDGAETLLALITAHVIKNGLTGLPICNQPKDTQDAILQFISTNDLTAEEIHSVEQSRFWTPTTKEPLLLLRGLIAGGVLRFALSQKRWRVNYGLDPTRIPNTPLAVPYRAKDTPSPRSEFSHPDVVILLTLLSYYYGGLTDDELFDSFVHLLRSDQASIQYDEWVRTASSDLPDAFRQISGVSIKDRIMCVQQVFPHLRYSRAAINYHLTFLIFPKAMKEFPSKLSASGWDLGEIKTHPTTGFSGTNDTLHVLPLSMNHLNLANQSHTNALVLGHLLQNETSVEKIPVRSTGTDAEHLLKVINTLQPEVRVVLDVGAQILEMENTQVAQCWLSMRQDDRTEAVVFFKDDELSVLDVSGRIEAFQTSPFAKQLDRCLVYLDEAHTRGTDLKLPRDYRAAVTLGSGLTKDRLVQACMRLRKLGKGQSVVFLASQEICTKICERTEQLSEEPLTVTNVLCWSICETWLDLSRSMPLWAVQGHRYETHKHILHSGNTTTTQAEAFLEDEAQSIEDRYAPITTRTMHSIFQDLSDPNIRAIHDRCVEFQAMVFNSASLQEEQERELSPEIEEERQIERPPKMDADDHSIHSDLKHLVVTGVLRRGSPAFEPAFQALRSTSAAKHYDLTQLPKELLVTKDFMRTVKNPSGSKKANFVSDCYQRPVQWVLSVPDEAASDAIKLVILSPFEASRLQNQIQQSKKVTLHLFAPRFNASFAPLDDLELFNVGRTFTQAQLPLSLKVQLNLFAGSLYLRSFAEYQAVCDFLGLLRDPIGSNQQVFADGFIDPPRGKWGLKTSPVQFLRALLMKLRKEGEGVEKTHMGRLLSGVRLEECDFEVESS
ncbi:hypothetical protein G6514_003880 [Epicoccum nigrum]|nr:hypothetical protein G6514_003880 [Epicoccum nigrum]